VEELSLQLHILSDRKSEVHTILRDFVEESTRIMEAATKRGIVLKLLGGLAIRFHCPSARRGALNRQYADIDFVGLSNQSRNIRKLFTELGYVPRDIFNTLQGDRRLIFNDLEHERRIDIFLDVFEMCHKFRLKGRLGIDDPTIPLADLLMTKLQVVETTEREYKDTIALVLDHEVGGSDIPETINGRYIASLCADDWGIYKTLTNNISNVLLALPRYGLEHESEQLVGMRLQELQNRIENTPKTIRWKLRARVGEKKRWYEIPESDRGLVDS